MSEMLTITIDDKECTCEAGEYLYDVAKRNGIFIPTFCRHDAFEDHRACCRICIVEVETRGRTKVVTACVYPIEETCTVHTKSERIMEERSVIMALLAHRAPDAAMFKPMVGRIGAEETDRLVTLDGEKCILCGLCVQACDSLGTGAISTVLRGTEKMVDTPYGKESAACVGCLSCANVCPTGAIDYTETQTQRTIWNRTFTVACCQECGTPLGTEEAIRYAAAGDTHAQQGEAQVCDACRKKHLADEMVKTYAPI